MASIVDSASRNKEHISYGTMEASSCTHAIGLYDCSPRRGPRACLWPPARSRSCGPGPGLRRLAAARQHQHSISSHVIPCHPMGIDRHIHRQSYSHDHTGVYVLYVCTHLSPPLPRPSCPVPPPGPCPRPRPRPPRPPPPRPPPRPRRPSEPSAPSSRAARPRARSRRPGSPPGSRSRRRI